MAEEQPLTVWPMEIIPDADDLFMRVHRQFVVRGELQPGVFRDQGRGMSTDWSKYATPQAAHLLAKDPALNGIIALRVGEVRKIKDLSVEHAPTPMNRAHCEVLGDKKRDPEIRVKLRRIARWQIPVGEAKIP